MGTLELYVLFPERFQQRHPQREVVFAAYFRHLPSALSSHCMLLKACVRLLILRQVTFLLSQLSVIPPLGLFGHVTLH